MMDLALFKVVEQLESKMELAIMVVRKEAKEVSKGLLMKVQQA